MSKQFIHTAGQISVEHVTISLRYYIYKDADDLIFPPDVVNNPSNPEIKLCVIKGKDAD